MGTIADTIPAARNGRRRTITLSSAAHSVASATQNVANTARDISHQDAPRSFWSEAAISASRAPSIREIRRGSFGRHGWRATVDGEESAHKSIHTTALQTHSESKQSPMSLPEDAEIAKTLFHFPTEEGVMGPVGMKSQHQAPIDGLQDDQPITVGRDTVPAVSWTTSVAIGFKAFVKWTCSPFGFFVLLYALNVVAWGGMLFLLLCNASPAMCWAPVASAEAVIHRSPAAALKWLSTQPRVFNCSSINSPRRIWIEVDSQILNALFCVTGLGLVPWRFRDLYYLSRYRFTSQRRSGLESKMYGLRVLAGFHMSWFRLPGSSTLDELSLDEYQQSLNQSSEHWLRDDIRVPLPSKTGVGRTQTGERAVPTEVWKMDLFVWCNIWNTLFQVVLCVFMWNFDRYNRPSWATGLFIALACIVAGVGGLVSFLEGKKVKRVEGVAVTNSTNAHDPEKGICRELG